MSGQRTELLLGGLATAEASPELHGCRAGSGGAGLVLATWGLPGGRKEVNLKFGQLLVALKDGFKSEGRQHGFSFTRIKR